MKKNESIPERITVHYKGDTFILQPGHRVFELNIKTGIIREHGLRKRLTLFFWREPVYEVRERSDLIHVPAHDLYKDAIKLRSIAKTLGIAIDKSKLRAVK